MTESEILTKVIIDGIQDKKGEKIVKIDLQSIQNSVCDYFIVCEAETKIQIQAIADNVARKVKTELHENVYNKEGYDNAQWVLLDFSSVVVHIFENEFREFLDLESLWADAEVMEIMN